MKNNLEVLKIDDKRLSELSNVKNETQAYETILKQHLKLKTELRNLTVLEIRIDTIKGLSFSVFGEILVNLETLRLSNSNLGSLCDLGTGFSKLKSLSLANCKLKTLQGLTGFENLQELFAPFNMLQDIFDVTYIQNTI